MRKPIVALACVFALAVLSCARTIERGNPAPLAPAEPIGIVVWSSRDLPKRLHQQIAAIEGVRWVSRVSNGMVDLVGVSGSSKPLPPRARGGVFPISIAAMDPTPDKGDVVSAALMAGEAVMSETAAALRGIRPGATITIGADGIERTFRVGAVVSDSEARDREVLIPFAGSSDLGLTAPRAIVSSVVADRISGAVGAMHALTEGVPARIEATDVVENADEPDSLLTFAEIKRIFGEWTFRPTSGRFIVPHPAWKEANIVEVRIPLLGLIVCNRKIVPQLTGAMRELIARGLGGLVRTSNGCYSPRMQVGNSYALSRHAYGIAVDLNAGSNPYGEPPSQDPRLVEVMERWGFTWGGHWLVPDGMHFEFVRWVDPASPPPIPAVSPATGS